MISARLDPCVIPPVAESLAATGSDGPLLTIAVIGAIVLVAAGAIAMFMAKTLRGKIAAFVLPAVLLGSLAFNSPAPAFATTGAPTVTTEAVVVSVWDAPLVKYSVTEVTAATFGNPEGCGVLSYQWQKQALMGDAWVDAGVALTSAEPLVTVPCVDNKARLLTTLTNNTDSVTSISNEVFLCD